MAQQKQTKQTYQEIYQEILACLEIAQEALASEDYPGVDQALSWASVLISLLISLMASSKKEARRE